MDIDDVVVRKTEATAIIVFIGNIPNGLADDHMIKLLHAAGNLRQWKRVRDNMGSKRSYGFVHFIDPISVLRCDRILNNYTITSPLGIEGKLAVRIDEKTKKQLDKWLQDNPKDGNAQFDAPYIAKVSAIVEELQDEKPMSYQLMNVEKEKTEHSVRQIHEQRRKAVAEKGMLFQEIENLDAIFKHRLKQWQLREKEQIKLNQKFQKQVDFIRKDRDSLRDKLMNWEEESAHLYYTHRTRYLKERRPFRIQEERQDGWDFRQSDQEAFKLKSRKRQNDDSGVRDNKRPKIADVPALINEIPEINWQTIEREVIDSFKPIDRKSTRLNSSHLDLSRMPSSA